VYAFRNGPRKAGDEDAAEMGVKEVDYFTSVRLEDTIAVTEAFDRVCALLLAVCVVNVSFNNEKCIW